ncbi:glycoside hydrolase family 140 protein [Terrimonas pollutisoli]|uniref:glycoside hydrolase family 140 protein n=1 Tax=Terrimonas pollutisoli TaxID=3034147 RepID=UPI0023EC8ECC|nr:glycoside hydrolase family 140 protein [Terrimonas sp. H1YJ31]
MKKVLMIAGLLLACMANAQVKQLKISANKRFFQTEDGKPFFWIGDTGWLLFVKCNREDAVHYLETRKQQGFNVVQVMVLHDMNNTKNVYGDSALINEDASTPKVTPGNDYKNDDAYDYWDHVDFIVDEAAKRGIYIAMVPVWGSNVKGGKVSVQQGVAYATFLANRYKNKSNIIWLNGGDVKGTDGMEVWEMIGTTLKKHDTKHLVTYHPRGRTSSSDWFHNEAWLDFNMFQSGHKDYAQDTISAETNHYGEDNWKFINVDYDLKPTKPTLDGEPSYENIPHGLHDSLQPRWHDADVRRYAYWSVFAGGAGFTYGENATMQFNSMGDWTANYGVTMNWRQAVLSPGATQMIYLKKLMVSKPYFDRVPAQDAVVDSGERYDRVAATRGNGYALFYVYNGRNFKVDIAKLKFAPTKANWYSPKTGKEQVVAGYKNKAIASFDPPGEQQDGNDWVLILEK